jgi:hypothetical protein
MQMETSESSVVAHMNYWAEERILKLEFRENGYVYLYLDVPPGEYAAFSQAESKGTYLNQVFKARKYRCIQIK